MTARSGQALRVEKRRSEAVIQLATGKAVSGNFFTGGGTLRHSGDERIGDLLNAETGFFPFEVPGDAGARTVIYNRTHIVTVMVPDSEPRQNPGYEVATRRSVSMLLSTGQRLSGAIRVYQPDGHDRLSDWSKTREQFHYLETATSTFLINAAHIVEVSEIAEAPG